MKSWEGLTVGWTMPISPVEGIRSTATPGAGGIGEDVGIGDPDALVVVPCWDASSLGADG